MILKSNLGGDPIYILYHDLPRPKHTSHRFGETQNQSRALAPIIVLDLLRIGILDGKSQLHIVDCSLGIVPPKFLP